MKKIFALALTLVLALTVACALGENEGAIVQSSCSIVQSGEYYLVYCFAQVHNNTNEIICLEKGSFDLQSGEQILATNEVNQIWPYFINPGEDGYLFDVVTIEPDENGNPVVPAVTGISYQIEYMTVNPAFANRSLEASATLNDSAEGLNVLCRLTNTSSEDVFEPSVSFGLYTETGSMVYADGMTVHGVGVPAGGTVLLRFDVEDVFSNQWRSAGFMPTEVRLSATYRNDED